MKLTLESSHQEKIMDLDNKNILISLLNCCTSFDPISPLILQVFCNLMLTTLEFPTQPRLHICPLLTLLTMVFVFLFSIKFF